LLDKQISLNEKLNVKDVEIMELKQENMEMRIQLDKKNRMPKNKRYLSRDACAK
jgi:nucleoid-associated protein YejK